MRKPIKELYIENAITESRLKALANKPGVTLDVTNFDLRRLPAHVRGDLVCHSVEGFVAPELETCVNIFANFAENEFRAPKLRAAGNIIAPHVSSFYAPLLETAGDIDILCARNLELSGLRESGHICKVAFDILNSPPLSPRVRKPKAANRAP